MKSEKATIIKARRIRAEILIPEPRAAILQKVGFYLEAKDMRELRQDICLLYLTGVSTRTLSLISARLLGRKVSAGEVSRVSKELVEAV